jgi:hypothetical protein
VLVALALPVTAPWSENTDAPSALTPSSFSPAVLEAAEPAQVPAAVPPAKVDTPAVAEGCRPGVLVTVAGWTKEATGQRTLSLAGLGLSEGSLAIAALGDDTLGAPRASAIVGGALSTLSAVPLAPPPLPLDAEAVAEDVEGLVDLHLSVAWDEVYYHWTRQDASYLVGLSAVVPAWLPQEPATVCDPAQPILDALPLDTAALLGLADVPLGDGWYMVGWPRVEGHVAAAGLGQSLG